MRGHVMDAVDELNIPDRVLYLLDVQGNPVKPAKADDWIRQAARKAGTDGQVIAQREIPGQEKTLRLHAVQFQLASGRKLVAVAVADQEELENKYADLIAAFVGVAFAALFLVAAGGFLLVRKSTAPIERSIEFMQRFMADAAHELRTPITILRSRAEDCAAAAARRRDLRRHPAQRRGGGSSFGWNSRQPAGAGAR